MKERPILFKGEMVRAVLDGSKTETRRVVRPNDQGRTWQDINEVEHVCPYGVPGDHLWVRETWCFDELTQSPLYRADYEPDELKGEWKPSIHMFRKYSRILLEVTEVAVERVREITVAGIRNEGLRGQSLSLQWIDLWDSINEKRGFSWLVNPWVWVVSFRHLDLARVGADSEASAGTGPSGRT